MSSSLMRFFGRELRHERESAGATQKEVAGIVRYSESKVGAVERGEQLPTIDYCERLDAFFGTNGRFKRMREELLTEIVDPEWLQPWTEHERSATSLWWYELAFIPGLLQTEAYARLLIGDDDSKVATRMARQEVLVRDEPPPPDLVVLLDEHAIRRPVGDGAVMREQLLRIIEAAERFVVQVIPQATRTYHHLNGPFVIATVGGREMVYLSTQARGFVLDSPEVASNMRRRWDLIRAEALPVGQSVKLIQEATDQWM